MPETADEMKARLLRDIDYFAKLRELDECPPTAADTMATLGLQAGALDNPVTYWVNREYFKPHGKHLMIGKLKPETKYSALEDWCLTAAGLK
ncbi:MAG: hypothetical protein PSV23_04635 [Brevundimonas sp.]|uniref:hypothetical protein n=1 Tax=Brevundimonas sp. TaxID=1871086 RepID=UPI0024894F98|nr:hypothetical protein [Brevundimonas sp.]MDI1326069.1 hypothetical protein [Brevundimonas sp.]